jgi:hypothetical protein
MNNLSIEELKYISKNLRSYGRPVAADAIDELIAIRELKGDQVQSLAEYCAEAAEVVKTWPQWKQDGADVTKFTAPQKPVVPDDATVLAWGERNDIKGDVSRLRCMIDDAATLPAGGIVKESK